MKKDGWNESVYCPECDFEIRAAFYAGSKGSTYGPPESCFPPEAPDLDYEHEECPNCEHRFTESDVDKWIDDIEEGRRGER